MIWLAVMVGVALADEGEVSGEAAPEVSVPLVEVTLVSRMTELQEYWSVVVPPDGVVLEERFPTARRRWLWEVTLTMEMGAPPEAIPFQFELAEVKVNRRGETRRREVITAGEVVTHNGGRANFESVVKDHKGRAVEDFEVILRPRLQ